MTLMVRLSEWMSELRTKSETVRPTFLALRFRIFRSFSVTRTRMYFSFFPTCDYTSLIAMINQIRNGAAAVSKTAKSRLFA